MHKLSSMAFGTDRIWLSACCLMFAHQVCVHDNMGLCVVVAMGTMTSEYHWNVMSAVVYSNTTRVI